MLKSRWCLFSLSDNGFIFFRPPNIFHHELFSTKRYIPNSDILGHKEFSTQRHSWLQLFPPPNIFSNEAFSKPKTFSATRHFQLQFLGSRSITSSWNMRKMEKRASYHCSDKIMFVRLIQNESLTPTPTPHEQVTPWGIFHRETFFEQYSINYQLPKYEKNEKRASYHCSDKIIFFRLIQNESLTPTPTPHE